MELNLKLGKRDLAVLTYIAENRFAPIDILRDLFWEGKKDNAEYRRLRQLCKIGLTAPLHLNQTNHKCYRLTEKGVGFVKAKGLAPVIEGKMIPRYGTTFEHDRNLQLIHRIFKSCSLVEEYMCELEVRKTLAEKYGFKKKPDLFYKVPDAAFILRFPDKTLQVAIELELAAKSMSRTRKMIEMLAKSPDFHTTLFVVGSDRLLLRIRNIIAQMRKDNPTVRFEGKNHFFYSIALATLLVDGKKAKWGGEGTFSLTALEEDARRSVQQNVQTDVQ